MSHYEIYIYPAEYEVGELGKPRPKKIVPPKPTFGTNILKVGQSKNVVDTRFQKTYGMHAVQVFGSLTWNTWFHTSISVKPRITSALQVRGFNVFGVNIGYQDAKNSRYSFEIFLNVYDQYGSQEVVNSLVDALTESVALRGSVQITGVYEPRQNIYAYG
jgi:hypothetical protein